MPLPELVTRRCLLRPWRDEDLEPFARMNADPRVMEHFPSVLSRTESDAFVERMRRHFADYGFGFWALEIPEVAPFIGFVGLANVPFDAHFTPSVEIGWRLDPAHWRRGYAREAANAALTFAFETLELGEVVAQTIPGNAPSRAVMSAIGMRRDPADDFDHPRLAVVSFPPRCVLYRTRRSRLVYPSLVERARAFASALDADDFERARPLLASSCRYEVRGTTLSGANAILRSYADAARQAHALFDEVRYESRIEMDGAAAVLHLTDVLIDGEREHRFRSVQRLGFDPEGKIATIEHEDLPGEREAVATFIASVTSPG